MMISQATMDGIFQSNEMNNACLHHHSITPTELLEAIKQIVDELQLHAIQRIIRVLQMLTLHVLEWI
jgi:hypothetical protein